MFYSWQSDLPNRCNRSAIESALQSAIDSIGRDTSLQLAPRLDRDTVGVPGSPDIGATILAKIDASTAFVADVSIISPPGTQRPTSNPNVLVELGYALKAVGPGRIIMVFNESFGAVEDLPFDLRFKRVLTYTLPEDGSAAEGRKELAGRLENALRLIFEQLRTAERDAEVDAYISQLAPELISFLATAQQMSERVLNPWFDSAQYQFRANAATFRDLAVPDQAAALGVADDLRKLATLIDAVARHITAIGKENWDKYLVKVDTAVNAALAVKGKAIDVFPLGAESRRSVVAAVSQAVQKIKSLSVEATEEMNSSGYEHWQEIRDKASEVGHTLVRISYLPSLSDIVDTEQLRPIAMELHQLEMIEQRTYGRTQIDECLSSVVKLASRLEELAGRG